MGIKKNLLVLVFSLSGCLLAQYSYANNAIYSYSSKMQQVKLPADTIAPADVMEVINTVIDASEKFKSEAVANLYTPNAVIADDQPPYSWNGPTAGVQWVSSIEEACKSFHITKFKAAVGAINICRQTADNVYIIVPVNYTGNMPGKARFKATGAFTFVLRLINGHWVIKSQAWAAKRGFGE